MRAACGLSSATHRWLKICSCFWRDLYLGLCSPITRPYHSASASPCFIFLIHCSYFLIQVKRTPSIYMASLCNSPCRNNVQKLALLSHPFSPRCSAGRVTAAAEVTAHTQTHYAYCIVWSTLTHHTLSTGYSIPRGHTLRRLQYTYTLIIQVTTQPHTELTIHTYVSSDVS